MEIIYIIIGLLVAILFTCIFGFQRIYLKINKIEYTEFVKVTTTPLWRYEVVPLTKQQKREIIDAALKEATKLQTPPEKDE